MLVFKMAAVFQDCLIKRINNQSFITFLNGGKVNGTVRVKFRNVINVWLLVCSRFKSL